MIYERMKKEYQTILEQIRILQAKIACLPEGKFVCSRSGSYFKWYQSDGAKKTYIPKKNRKLAEQLAQKKYFTYQLDDLMKEKTAIEFYLQHYSPPLGKADFLLINEPGYTELLTPYFKPKSQELSDWMHSPYERNDKYPEQLVHKAPSNNFVRSKSEAMIDLLLSKNRIPFRYECALHLDNITFFPDFTIRHPKTGDFYYWEHFGLMDDPSYSQNTFTKLKVYSSFGIIPNIQLITTYETKEHPLGFEMIEEIIRYYFL